MYIALIDFGSRIPTPSTAFEAIPERGSNRTPTVFHLIHFEFNPCAAVLLVSGRSEN